MTQSFKIQRKLRAIGIVAELVALRALLPRWFLREPLDRLVVRLARGRGGCPTVELAELEAELRRGEALLRRATRRSSTCLYRSLARFALLHRHGYEPTFLMGLPRTNDGKPGHAWVEVAGVPFAEAEDLTRFKVTFRYPPADNGGRVETP